MIKKYILSELDSLIERLGQDNKTSLIVFKGFPDYFYSHLINNYTSLGISEYRDTNGFINVEKLEEHKGTVISRLFNSIGVVWAYYEEFILVSENINNINDIYPGSIIIVNNNLFHEKYYPITIEISKAKSFINYINSDNISDEYAIMSKYYNDCFIVDNDTIVISYINKHIDEGIKEIPFILCNAYISKNINKEINKSVHIKHNEYYQIRNLLQNDQLTGDIQIVIDKKEDEKLLLPFTTLLNKTEVSYCVILNNQFEDLDDSDENKYINILKKYWKTNKFRYISFYKNPDISTETIKISQGNIINYIINQCIKSLNDQDDFTDIFITAPTGSGKSLLFQIPAIELMNKYNLVTIVITPLKALMVDQYKQLTEDRLVSGVTFLNSDITPQEKEKRIIEIKEGRVSLLYLSPELLLSNSLESIIGGRKLGLLVVDEAHLVTTWGRDFRADYWFLGGYIDKLRKSIKFPILCLTATAVYMGIEDTVNDTITSLNLIRPKIYLGNVRRDNIKFDINIIKRNEIDGGFEDFKIKRTCKRIQDLIDNNKKCICYCPYTSQVEDIYANLEDKYKKNVGKYYSSYDKYCKKEAQEKFRTGELLVMICTKAFGMGVDIPDVDVIYHFAPTGNLADYVQEIGRVARDSSITGIAKTDFTTSDLKYVRMLNGLSGIKQYQLKEMIRKLYILYNEKKKRNLLISPEVFSYLFTGTDLVNKVKNGLLLLSKDLELKYTFKVLTLRPKSMFTKNYVCVPDEINEKFVNDYRRFIKPIYDDKPRLLPSYTKTAGDTLTKNRGKIYEINMSELWEESYSDYTFGKFKREFFEGNLFNLDESCKLTARFNLVMRFKYDFDKTKVLLEENLENLIKVFAKINTKGFFNKSDFRTAYKYMFKHEVRSNEIPNVVLDLFVADISKNVGFRYNKDKFKFIQQRKAQNKDETVYRIMNKSFTSLKGRINRIFLQCKDYSDNNVYSTYIPITKGKKHDLLYLAILLEIFGLASYEVSGGKEMEIFVRINDPTKLRRLSNSKYYNSVLSDIEKKRKMSQDVLGRFMSTNLSDSERWDVIENYFLGNQELVDLILRGETVVN